MTTDSPEWLKKKVGEEALDLSKRVEAAQKMGSRGVVFFRPPSSGVSSRYFRARVDKKVYKPDFVLLSIENKILNFIFKDLPVDTRTVFSRMSREKKPQSLATGVKTFVSVNATFNPKTPTRNVLSKISGADKNLKDEYIIIGAHMDHLGVSPMGDVYNGANDNGSGTVVIMELARASLTILHLDCPLRKPRLILIWTWWELVAARLTSAVDTMPLKCGLFWRRILPPSSKILSCLDEAAREAQIIHPF